MPEHGKRMLFLETHGAVVPLTTVILAPRIGGKPFYMRQDISGFRQCYRFHVMAIRPADSGGKDVPAAPLPERIWTHNIERFP